MQDRARERRVAQLGKRGPRIAVDQPQALAAADAALNRAYQAVMRAPDTTVAKADVRAAQRLWLAYRDAWTAFAALRYPALPRDVLQATLTEWRTKQLM